MAKLLSSLSSRCLCGDIILSGWGKYDGNRKELEADERYYAPSEISWYLTSLRFKKSSIHGCRLGNFSRDHVLTTDDFEMLVIAEK